MSEKQCTYIYSPRYTFGLAPHFSMNLNSGAGLFLWSDALSKVDKNKNVRQDDLDARECVDFKMYEEQVANLGQDRLSEDGYD